MKKRKEFKITKTHKMGCYKKFIDSLGMVYSRRCPMWRGNVCPIDHGVKPPMHEGICCMGFKQLEIPFEKRAALKMKAVNGG